MLNKFTEQTNEYFVGITFNNCKEWFHAHRDMYRAYVHEPISELADEVYFKMHQMDKSFEELPKISRANRDIRFSKNKNPYKESKWFFLRGDGKPDLCYSKPTYFFEAGAEWWRYGLFFAPKPSHMAVYRKKIEAEEARFKRIVTRLEKSAFFAIDGDSYKREFKNNLAPELNSWYQRKNFELTRYEDYSNSEFYGDNLPDIVFEGFKELYEMYKFLLETDYR